MIGVARRRRRDGDGVVLLVWRVLQRLNAPEWSPAWARADERGVGAPRLCVGRRRVCVLGPHDGVFSLSLSSLCARGLEVRVRHPLRQRGQAMTVQAAAAG